MTQCLTARCVGLACEAVSVPPPPHAVAVASVSPRDDGRGKAFVQQLLRGGAGVQKTNEAGI